MQGNNWPTLLKVCLCFCWEETETNVQYWSSCNRSWTRSQRPSNNSQQSSRLQDCLHLFCLAAGGSVGGKQENQYCCFLNSQTNFPVFISVWNFQYLFHTCFYLAHCQTGKNRSGRKKKMRRTWVRGVSEAELYDTCRLFLTIMWQTQHVI